MRCTDCQYMKETIPEQLNYVYCSVHQKEMPVWKEFSRCPNENDVQTERIEPLGKGMFDIDMLERLSIHRKEA